MAENTDKPINDTKAQATTKAPKPASVDNSLEADPTRKVGLVELIMILMLVGVVLVFIFGMQQMKINKAKEAIAQQKFEAVIPVFENILKAVDEYKRNDPFGDYPATLEELGNFDTADFKFEYSLDNLSITAVTTKEYGKEGIKVIYSIANAIYEVSDPTPAEKPTVLDEWLP